jgi:hypothetical protein
VFCVTGWFEIVFMAAAVSSRVLDRERLNAGEDLRRRLAGALGRQVDDGHHRPLTSLLAMESFKLLPLAVGAAWLDCVSAGAEDSGMSPNGGGASADILLGKEIVFSEEGDSELVER